MEEELRELEEKIEEVPISENKSEKESQLPIKITPKKNRIIVMQVGNIVVEDEPARKSGFIGGYMYVRNAETGEEISKAYKTLHDGSTTKWKLAGELLKQMLPPEEETEEESPDEE